MKKKKELEGLLEGLELDAILVSNAYNMRYFSGFSGGEGFVLIMRGLHRVLTDSRYTIWAKEEAGADNVIEVSGKEDDFLQGYFDAMGIKRMGFESRHISYARYQKWKDVLKEIELVPLERELDKLRYVKTEEELGCIKESAAISDRTFTELLTDIKEGVTERELANHIEYLVKRNGAEGVSFEPIVASGLHSARPHAFPTNKKLQKGDLVILDFGCRYQGYCSDMTRTIIMGKASNKQKAVYQTVLEAQLTALTFIKAGYMGKEVDAKARDYIGKAGYGQYFGHGLGHAVGLEIHEKPTLSPQEEERILANMVETVEPGIYIEGLGGVRIEDLIVVTEDGCKNLTHSPKELMEL